MLNVLYVQEVWNSCNVVTYVEEGPAGSVVFVGVVEPRGRVWIHKQHCDHGRHQSLKLIDQEELDWI